MATKPVKKGTNQTEKKAKGLVGWKNGKPEKDAPYKVGDYKGRTLNLTKRQLGKAGRAAAAARTVDIERTRYEGKKVLGPMGKPLTGTVDLGGGNIAVYKNGVRVSARSGRGAGAGGGKGGGGGGGGGGGKGSGGWEANRKAGKDVLAKYGKPVGPGRRSINTTTLEGIKYASLTPAQKKWYESVSRATGKPPSIPNTRTNPKPKRDIATARGLNPATGGTRPPARPLVTGNTKPAKPRPKTGETRPAKGGGRERWTGTAWVKVRGK